MKEAQMCVRRGGLRMLRVFVCGLGLYVLARENAEKGNVYVVESLDDGGVCRMMVV